MRDVVVDKRGPKRDWVRLVRARKKNWEYMQEQSNCLGRDSIANLVSGGGGYVSILVLFILRRQS